MRKAPPRTPLPGPAFIRLLARLTDVEVPPSRQALSERLSQWVDWNRAIVLSRALDGSPDARDDAPIFDSAQEAECARLRAALTQAILQAPESAAAVRTAPDATPTETPLPPAPPDFSPWRKRYVLHQQAMQTATGDLRGRLREMLAARSAQMARLAEVDAVMELTLSPREQRLLASVPALLGEHFDRLHQAAAAAQDHTALPDHTLPTPAGAGLDRFGRDMQQLLLAELDLRFQPIDGLLAALRTP